MNKLRYILSLIALAAIMLSCSNSANLSSSFHAKPTAFGKRNSIVVIAEDNVWNGMPGDTFNFYFGSAYPILNYPEPMFDIRQYTAEKVGYEPYLNELRAYVVLSIMDEKSSTTKMIKEDLGEEKWKRAQEDDSFNTMVGRDKWAKNQLIYYLFADSHEKLANLIKEKFPLIAQGFNEHDHDQLQSNTFPTGHNLGMSKRASEKYGLDIKIPMEYKVAKEEDKLSWYRRDLKDFVLNIVFEEFDYVDEAQLDKSNIIKWRNNFGKDYVESDKENDYMRVNEEDLPIYEYSTEVDGMFTKEVRGVWEMNKAFIGGPFISYAILTPENKILYTDVFIFAPGKDKRNRIQELDYIIKSIQLLNH